MHRRHVLIAGASGRRRSCIISQATDGPVDEQDEHPVQRLIPQERDDLERRWLVERKLVS